MLLNNNFNNIRRKEKKQFIRFKHLYECIILMYKTFIYKFTLHSGLLSYTQIYNRLRLLLDLGILRYHLIYVSSINYICLLMLFKYLTIFSACLINPWNKLNVPSTYPK